MSIRVTCPDCKSVLTVADSFRGMQIQCQHCAEMIQVGEKIEEPVEETAPTLVEEPAAPPAPRPKPRPRPVQAAPPKKPAPKPEPAAIQRPRPSRPRTEERARRDDNDLAFDDLASRPRRGSASA